MTPHETDVLKLLGRGLANKEIGRALGCGSGTVKNGVQRVIAKLGVSNRSQAAVRAAELGLVEPR